MPGQRLGRECFAAYKRAWRARTAGNLERVGDVKRRVSPKKEAADSETGNTEPAPFVPFIGGTSSHAEPWYDTFLRDLALRGSVTLAAAAARVHRSTAYRHMEADLQFAAEVEAAQSYYREYLEWESVDLGHRKGNPLPYFARLKAELPSRYIERQAVLQLAVNASEVPPEQWQALLRAIATDTMAETRVRFGMADDVHLIPCGDSPVPPLNPAPS